MDRSSELTTSQLAKSLKFASADDRKNSRPVAGWMAAIKAGSVLTVGKVKNVSSLSKHRKQYRAIGSGGSIDVKIIGNRNKT